MIGELSNHLWQSTVFVVCAALLAAALRKNGAHVRHLVWLTASVKFLVPFSLLMSLGSQWAWTRPAVSATGVSPLETASVFVDQVAQPFTATFPPAAAQRSEVDWLPLLLAGLWICGFVAILLMRVRSWTRVRAAVRSSVPITVPGVELPRRVDVRAAAGLLEPGIVGLWRPVLLLPAGIGDHLTPIQLEAVLAHELCHVRRRDNFTAAMHMVVEAVFWFHPLVWWIGARMVDERERACDEHVLRVLGKPEAYAEGILNVCKLYVESPLTCVSGVTGSNLKKRIEAIMINHVGLQLNASRRIAIVAAAVLALTTPVVVGVITAPIRTSAYAQDAGGPERFEVVSVKPCAAVTPPAGRNGAAGWHAQTSPGRVYWDCVTLATLVDQAYADTEHPLLNIAGDSRPPEPVLLPGPIRPKRVRGGPSWVEKDLFTIEAKTSVELTAPALSGAARRNLGALSPGLSHALRATLTDRFQLKVRRAADQQTMYALRAAATGLNKNQMKATSPGDCVTRAVYSATDPADRAGLKICGNYFVTAGAWEFTGATVRQLAQSLSGQMDRYVIDESKADGMFNFVLSFGNDPAGGDFETRAIRGLKALGLKIQPTKAPAEYFLIDHAERPTPDSAFAERFEVASIKPCFAERPLPGAGASSGQGGGAGPGGGTAFTSSPGRLHIECVRLAMIVDTAYIKYNGDAKEFGGWAGMGSTYDGLATGPLKVRGGPSWAYNDRWTIDAKAPGVATDDALMGPMLRALLEDRFHLKLHTDREEAPMWTLNIAKGGLKIKPMKDGECNPDRTAGGVPVSRAIKEGIKPTCNMVNAGANGTNWRWEHGGQDLGAVASMLSVDLGAPVVDRTGVTGKFNIVWEYGPDENTPKVVRIMERFAPASGPPTAANIFTALEEQLGLRLEKTKGPRGFIVIDGVERPAPDSPFAFVKRP